MPHKWLFQMWAQSDTLQMHCTENSKQLFLELKLRGLVPNFYIHVSVSNLYIPTIGPQTQYWTAK